MYCGNKVLVVVNSWMVGMEVIFCWWGIGLGDEVIVLVYIYCVSVNIIVYIGVILVFVDFN